MTLSIAYYLEFMTKNMDLETLHEHLNLSRGEVIAVGDSSNDLEMIEFAGLGVAMGNTCEDVKKCANYITTSNDEEGIYHVIENFIFKSNA